MALISKGANGTQGGSAQSERPAQLARIRLAPLVHIERLGKDLL